MKGILAWLLLAAVLFVVATTAIAGILYLVERLGWWSLPVFVAVAVWALIVAIKASE